VAKSLAEAVNRCSLTIASKCAGGDGMAGSPLNSTHTRRSCRDIGGFNYECCLESGGGL